MYAYDESYTIDFIEEFELNGKNELQPEKETENDKEDSSFMFDEEGYCFGYEDAMAGQPFCHNLFSKEVLNEYGGELDTEYVKTFERSYEIGYQTGMANKGYNFITINLVTTKIK